MSDLRELAFKKWLSLKFTTASASSRYSCAKRVEENYGDLDAHYVDATLEDVVAALHYSLADAKAGKPNPTKLKIDGNPYNVLNNFKTGVRTYRTFRADGGELEVATAALIEQAEQSFEAKSEGKQFDLEKDLQLSLRSEIAQLEDGLVIIDDGAERSVNSGDIDILAQDATGALVVIELKRGLARRDSIGQITGYMGDLMIEEPQQRVRGILVAGEFHKSCLGAERAVPELKLRRYRYNFSFDDPSA